MQASANNPAITRALILCSRSHGSNAVFTNASAARFARYLALPTGIRLSERVRRDPAKLAPVASRLKSRQTPQNYLVCLASGAGGAKVLYARPFEMPKEHDARSCCEETPHRNKCLPIENISHDRAREDDGAER